MSRGQLMVVAGEASGDQHAAAVVREIQRRRPELQFFGMGGPQLAAAAVDRIYDASEISVMGLVEVVPKLRRILKVMDGLERTAARRRPSCALLVDIPDFNLRLARKLRRLDIPVVYYVSPSIWAWRQGRADAVSARVNEMLCILPFEPEFYARHGVKAKYVGNPVVEQVPAPADRSVFRAQLGLAEDRPTLALLPGSRRGELKRLLGPMGAAARRVSERVPRLHVIVPVAPGLSADTMRPALSNLDVTFIEGRAPECVGASDVAVVASGTAALEAGLMERPMVVVYRVSPLTYVMAKPLMKVSHYSLVNLLAKREIVPELIQAGLTEGRLAEEILRLWPPSPASQTMVADLQSLRHILGPAGAASRAAEAVLQWT